MATIGFIGLGIMGAHMARNLIKGGHALVVNGKYPVPDDIRAQTQVLADSTAVAQASEIIITMVPDTPDVANALFADDGIANGLSEGKLVIDMSSINPLDTQDFAKKINALGCDYLDAPVSGGEVGARDATLTIMVGGPEKSFAIAKPLFDLMGKNISLIGDNGAGQTCKVANQIIVALNIEAVAEALLFAALGRRSGARASRVDGRLRCIAHSGVARRAHDEADVRSGLSHRAASKGPEPCARWRAQDGTRSAAYRERAAVVQRMCGERRQGVGPFGARACARDHVELPGGARVAAGEGCCVSIAA